MRSCSIIWNPDSTESNTGFPDDGAVNGAWGGWKI